jgi:predicted acylesterase/phospholipase RssA
MKHPPKSATPSERRQVDRTHPALVLLQAAEGVTAPLGALTLLLAQAVAGSFNDAVLVVHVTEPSGFEEEGRGGHGSGPPSMFPSTSIAGPASRTPSVDTEGGQVGLLRLSLPAEPRRAAAALADKLRRLLPHFAYVFVDASARGPELGQVLVKELASPVLEDFVRRLVLLSRGPLDHLPPVPAAWSVLVTELLDPVAERQAPPSLRARPQPGVWGKLNERAGQVQRMAQRLGERLGGDAIEPQGEPYPEARLIPERCRVRLDLPVLAGLREPAWDRLPEAARLPFARWGRALTWRRVGLALGGSGAWGYAHIALMRQLEARGVPIDLVGGSSSGSVMGAFYAVLGAPGLELAIARGARLEALAWLSLVSSTFIDLGADADLGSALLEDLEVLFLPVATNLTHGRAEVITRSTVASAVRASSSAPGLFASTITRTGLYVDGAISDNVPVVLVERMGADLLIACNPIPGPGRIEVRESQSPVGDFFAELSPWNRLRDLRISFAMMIHDFGDCEPADTRIVYEPPPDSNALFGTFRFSRARELVAMVEGDASFRETIDRSVEAWGRLSAPRIP